MRKRSSKRPGDANQVPEVIADAKVTADVAIGEAELPRTDEGKNPAAVALGRRGGLKGGKARAESLSKERRREIAKDAAKARWKKTGKDNP